jgi:hypothetical protein
MTEADRQGAGVQAGAGTYGKTPLRVCARDAHAHTIGGFPKTATPRCTPAPHGSRSAAP